MAIFTLLGTALSGLLFGGSLLAAKIIAGVLAFGVKLAVSYLTRKKARKYSAVQGESQLGGDVPAGTLFGMGPVKGQRVFYAKWGGGNRINAEVFLLANGWCDGLEPEIRFYGEKHDLVDRAIIGNEAAHYGIDGFGDLVSIRFYDGRPGQLADMKLVADTASLGRTWKATSRGTGLTYVVVERAYDSEKFAKGRPEFEFVLRGLREYDVRKDSTVAGGAGTHRLDDPATWEFSMNPVTHRMNYQLGLRGPVSGRVIVGEGKSLGQLDLGSYVAAANVADTPRNGKGLYECSLYVNGDDDHTEILREFDDAVAGYGMNRRGLSGIVAGAPQVPVLEITADDIPAARAKDVQRRKSAFELVNHLSGQFTSPENGWQPESLKPIKVNADVAADGRLRQASNDFLQVIDAGIAQYLLTIRYRQNRRGGSATLPVSWRVGLAVQEGEWVTWAGSDWLITGWQADEKFRFTLQLAETSADIYDDADIDPGPAIAAPPAPVNPALLTTVQNFAVAVGTVEGGGGHQVPALRFTWDPPGDPTITEVRFFYRVDGETRQFEDRSTTPEAGEHETTNNIQPLKRYQARATITTVPDRFKTFTNWQTSAADTGAAFYPIDLDQLEDDVTALLASLGTGIDAVSAGLSDEITARAAGDAAEASARAAGLATEAAARIADANALAERFRWVFDQLDGVGAVIAEQDYANYADKQQIRTEILAARGDLTAAYTQAITAAVGDGSAIAVRFEALEAEADALAASVLSETTARADADAALAQQITLLSAGSGDQFDWSAIWYFNTTVDGFTGNGTPTVSSDGFLRPANHGSDPYVISPDLIAVDGALYRQVRARIRKTGSPTWEGYLWWQAAGDSTWDAGRRVTIAEPSFDAGIANITFDSAWTGTIDQIRLDLSTAQTDTDCYEIDWIAVGRPSPGASSAQLYTESQARISGDAALALDITALTASLNDLDGEVAAQATAISALETDVSTLDGDVSANTTAITAIEAELPGLASASALSALETEVALLGGGSVVSNSEAIVALRNEVDELGALVAEGQYADHQGELRVRNALVSATQTLTTSIAATDGQVAVNASAITALQAALTGYSGESAVSTAFSSLTASVSTINGTLTSQGSAITALQNDLDAAETAIAGKAAQSALDTLTSTVTSQGGTISSQGSSITALQSEVDLRARTFVQTSAPTADNAGDLWFDSDDGFKPYRWNGSAWVAVQDLRAARTFAQTSAPTATATGDLWLDTDDSNKLYRWNGSSWVAIDDSRIAANASAISSLTSTVTSQGSSISSQGSAITALQNALTGYTGNGAVSSAFSSLNSTVSSQGSTIASQGSAITALQSEVDLRARTFVQTAAPTADNAGDLWFDSDDDYKPYRWSGSAWVAVRDTRAAKTFAQTSAPTATATGDLWIDTDDSNKLYRWNGSSWAAVDNGRIAANASAISSLSSTVTAQDGEITALSDALTAVETEVAGVTASGLFRMSSSYTPAAGWTSRIGMQARVGTGDAWETAGLFLEAKTGQSRALILANQFVVADASNVAKPFVFDGGVLYLDSIKARTANLDDLSVTSAKTQALVVEALA